MTTQEAQKLVSKVQLSWTGSGMEYRGSGRGGAEILLDGKSAKGPGPMEALLLSLAGCMALDVQAILERSRVPMTRLHVDVEGDRATTPPKRYTCIRMVLRVEGPGEEHRAKLERAVELSREKFCSVLHSLRTDTDFEIEIKGIQPRSEGGQPGA